MTRRRTLRPDEQELWRRVAQTTRPLDAFRKAPAVPRPRAAPEPAAPVPPPNAVPETRVAAPPLRMGGALRGSTVAAPSAAKTPAPAMDAKAYRRLTRGKLQPEARLDLHGMTLAQAQPVLSGFLRRAQADGRRLVLVITGKGRGGDGPGPLPYRPGALRHEVPIWLRRPPLRALVQEVADAHARHGGGGALYVYLRRPG